MHLTILHVYLHVCRHRCKCIQVWYDGAAKVGMDVVRLGSQWLLYNRRPLPFHLSITHTRRISSRPCSSYCCIFQLIICPIIKKLRINLASNWIGCEFFIQLWFRCEEQEPHPNKRKFCFYNIILFLLYKHMLVVGQNMILFFSLSISPDVVQQKHRNIIKKRILWNNGKFLLFFLFASQRCQLRLKQKYRVYRDNILYCYELYTRHARTMCHEHCRASCRASSQLSCENVGKYSNHLTPPRTLYDMLATQKLQNVHLIHIE